MHRIKKLLLIFVLMLSIGVPFQKVSAGLPKQATIKGVKGKKQSLNLSCESRSAVDWAAYWGVKIGEKTFLRKLPRSDDPNLGFVGNPNDVWGNIPPASYGVHAKPVADLLEDFGFETQVRKKFSWDDLRGEIAAGRPVIVWVIGQMENGRAVNIKTKAGKTVAVARKEHTMLVFGYDANKVYVVDAYTGLKQNYTKNQFLSSWSVLGNMAATGSLPEKTQKTTPVIPLTDMDIHIYFPFAAVGTTE